MPTSAPPVDRWAEIGDREHLVQFYEDPQTLVETLVEFIGGALRADGAGVVVATREHLEALEQELVARGIDVTAARKSEQYVALDAHDVMQQILVNHWPQPDRFRARIGSVIDKARGRWGSVRAYGEMVGLPWESGAQGAALRLEGLWNDLARTQAFALLCGYHVSQLRSGDRKAMALVVEDEALVRMFIVDQLEDLGFEVIDTGTAAEGLRAARSHAQLDVAIVDRGLPDRDGMDVVMELRTQLPSLPVIVASGYGDVPNHAALRNDAHIRFVAKPFDVTALKAALRALHVRTKEME